MSKPTRAANARGQRYYVKSTWVTDENLSASPVGDQRNHMAAWQMGIDFECGSQLPTTSRKLVINQDGSCTFDCYVSGGEVDAKPIVTETRTIREEDCGWKEEVIEPCDCFCGLFGEAQAWTQTSILLQLGNGSGLQLKFDRNGNLHGQDGKYCDTLTKKAYQHNTIEAGGSQVSEWVRVYCIGIAEKSNAV